MDVLRGDAARNLANVKFEAVVAVTIGHGVAARGHTIESDLGILSGREEQRGAIHRRDSHQLDVVGKVIEAGHDGLHPSRSLNRIIVIACGTAAYAGQVGKYAI